MLSLETSPLKVKKNTCFVQNNFSLPVVFFECVRFVLVKLCNNLCSRKKKERNVVSSIWKRVLGSLAAEWPVETGFYMYFGNRDEIKARVNLLMINVGVY